MKLSPKLRKTPKGLLTYDIGADIVLLFPVATKIQEKFGLESGRLPGFGLDNAFVELLYNDFPILVGWDIWSDLYVMAMDKKANEKVREIAEYLDTIMDELGELEDKLIAESKEKED